MSYRDSLTDSCQLHHSENFGSQWQQDHQLSLLYSMERALYMHACPLQLTPCIMCAVHTTQYHSLYIQQHIEHDVLDHNNHAQALRFPEAIWVK